jgi:hypothetical protein
MSTEEIRGVGASVRELGAIGDGLADDTAALQRALDSGSPLVVIPPGIYKISAALKLPSQITLRANPAATIRLADGAGNGPDVFLLTNRDHERGNSDIVIEGGIWDGNNEHNRRGERFGAHYSGVALNVIKAQRLQIRDLTVKNPEAFSIRLGEVEDFLVENITFDHPLTRPNQDGVHIGGYSQRGSVRNIKAVTWRTPNDDMVALNADDDVQLALNWGLKRGWIEDIVVENLTALDVETFLRLLSIDQLIENVTVSGVHGGCRYHAVNLNHWRLDAGRGNLHNITLADFSVHKSDLANPAPLIDMTLQVRHLRLRNFRRGADEGADAPTLRVQTGQANELAFQGLEPAQIADVLASSSGFQRLPGIGGAELFRVPPPGQLVLNRGSIPALDVNYGEPRAG